jgi:major membrane immunogen (membrane-anchored lipoprotein)
MMKYLIFILLICILLLTGCSKKENLINMKDCQEGCLSKNMSYSDFTSFKDNSTFLKCTCNFYLEVN